MRMPRGRFCALQDLRLVPSKIDKGPKRILWCFAEFSSTFLAAQALNTLQVGCPVCAPPGQCDADMAP